MATLLEPTLLSDTLQSLPGWEAGEDRIWRDVQLDPERDAELRRQVAVDAESMGHEPQIEDVEGGTRFVLRTAESGGVTELDIAFASHLSDLIHRIAEDEPGVEAVREGAPVVIVRPGESGLGEDATPDEAAPGEPPTIGVPSVTGGTTPRVPLPDEEPFAPEPGPSTEQTRP